MKFSVLKPLQAKRIVKLYNYQTSEEGYHVTRNSWKSAGITEAIEEDLVNLESLDPFETIITLEHGSTVPLIKNGNIDQFDISSFVTYYSNEDDDDEWVIEGNPIRNICEIIEYVA